MRVWILVALVAVGCTPGEALLYQQAQEQKGELVNLRQEVQRLRGDVPSPEALADFMRHGPRGRMEVRCVDKRSGRRYIAIVENRQVIQLIPQFEEERNPYEQVP